MDADDLARLFRADAEGLARAVELLVDLDPTDRAQPARSSHELTDRLPDQLPDRGSGATQALETLAPAFLGGARRLGAPGFFAHMDPPTPWITWAMELWAASRNQNLLHPETSPVATLHEQRVVAWLAPAFGMRGGHMVPGSSVANLTALWAARDVAGVEEIVASDRSHLSVVKAGRLLGLPVRTVPTDAAHRMRTDLIGDVSRSALVLTAGTVAAGAVDPLDSRHDAAWVHVDAAWGGPLRLSSTHAGLLDGVEAADSFAVSAHKWLFQPKESALVLFAEPDVAHGAMSFGGGYLAQPNVGVLGSHGAAALPLLATLLAWGRDGVEKVLDHCMELAAETARLVGADPRLELGPEPTTGVVVWRPADEDVDLHRLREAAAPAVVSLVDVGGRTWLRSVAANPMADPALVVGRVLAAIDEVS